MLLYHGSNVVVKHPEILRNGSIRILDMDFTVPILNGKLKDGL